MRFLPLFISQSAQKICTVVIVHVKNMGTAKAKIPRKWASRYRGMRVALVDWKLVIVKSFAGRSWSRLG